MSNWNKIFKPIVVLVIICIVITGALAATNSVTDPIIDEATRVAQQKARTELLPEAEDFEPVTGVEVENVSDIYASTNDVGVIITSSAKGYGGDVVVMTAFNPDGTIRSRLPSRLRPRALAARSWPLPPIGRTIWAWTPPTLWF